MLRRMRRRCKSKDGLQAEGQDGYEPEEEATVKGGRNMRRNTERSRGV